MRRLYWKKSDALKAVQTISGTPYLSSVECEKLDTWDEECDQRHPFGEVQCYRFHDTEDVIGWYDGEA